MVAVKETEKREEAIKSLERMQSFNINKLPREEALGRDLNFSMAVQPSQRLISLYKQISISVLEDLPLNKLNQLHDRANSDYSLFEDVLNFTTQQASPHDVRDQLITKIIQAYQPAFDVLHPIISYSASKSADIQRLETEARAMIQSVRDQGDELTKQLETQKQTAEQILEDVRTAAAEQGVSQQAKYFREESEKHNTEAEAWRKKTVNLAWLLGIYAVLTLFFHKIPLISPGNAYETVQLGISKVLIFAVISYMLYLSARNFLSHKHNDIINKHRQNALMTYTTLVDAAKETDNKEVILTHASSCIFGPQPTGYSRESGGNAPSAKSVVELLTKPLSGE